MHFSIEFKALFHLQEKYVFGSSVSLLLFFCFTSAKIEKSKKNKAIRNDYVNNKDK